MALLVSDLHEVLRGELVFTAQASSHIDGGDFVCAIGQTDDVVTSSGKSSLADSDIHVDARMSSALQTACVGMALSDAETNEYLSVSMKGVYIVNTDAAIVAGESVDASDTYPGCVGGGATSVITKVGKALTSSSASGKYIVIALHAI